MLHYVRTADDLDLYRIRILPLARTWSFPDRELLVACLHATRVGLLSMSWDIICPHCRGVRAELTSLGQVPVQGRCDICEIDFDNTRENSLEITFHIHPSIKEVPKRLYCSAEPATKAHIKIQQLLQPGETRALSTSLTAGRYRFRIKGSADFITADLGDAEGGTEISWAVTDPERIMKAGLHPRLRLNNPTAQPHTFIVEDARWQGDALRPAHLFNLQDFRDLFSEEYVATDMHLAVGEQTIVFTDMVGSTRYYDEEGDSRAFMQIRRHFQDLFQIIRKNGGAVIKTMGDGAMASFHTPLEAIRATIELQQRFSAESDSTIRIRATVNTGPCIAVNFNSNIDYFGQVVNIASKMQSLASAGQICVSARALASAGVQNYLKEAGMSARATEFRSESLIEPVSVYLVSAIAS